MMVLLSGILASSLHVVSGPDHLAAVTPLAIESKNKSWSIGMAWGFGHIFGVLLIGLLFMLFREVIPVEEISQYSEQIVGLVLIVIGVWALRKVIKKSPDAAHTHNHSHKTNMRTSLSVGILHGLAGVSHILAIIPALALPTRFDAGMYVAGFSIGTIVAMIVYSYLLGLIAEKSFISNKLAFLKGFRLTGSIFTIVVGIGWLAMTL